MLSLCTAALLALASTATAASPAGATPKACAQCKTDLQPLCNDYRLEPRFCGGTPPGAKKNVTGGITTPTCCSDGTWVCDLTFVAPCGGGARPANRCAKGDTFYDSSSKEPYPLEALQGKCPVAAPGKKGTFYMALSPPKEGRLLEGALYVQDNGAIEYGGQSGKFTPLMWQSAGSNKIKLSASNDLCLTVSSKGDNKVVTGPCGKARQWKTELKSKNATWAGPKGAIPQVHVRLVVDAKEKCMQLAVANSTIPVVVPCADKAAPWLLADKY